MIRSCISCLRHYRKFMKSCNNDLNLKTELPRNLKFDWLKMTYNQLYWAFWGRHWIKNLQSVTCTQSLALPDVAYQTWCHQRTTTMQGHSGLFKTDGFAGRQLEVKAIDWVFRFQLLHVALTVLAVSTFLVVVPKLPHMTVKVSLVT